MKARSAGIREILFPRIALRSMRATCFPWAAGRSPDAAPQSLPRQVVSRGGGIRGNLTMNEPRIALRSMRATCFPWPAYRPQENLIV
jgi:hypothetical protein